MNAWLRVQECTADEPQQRSAQRSAVDCGQGTADSHRLRWRWLSLEQRERSTSGWEGREAPPSLLLAGRGLAGMSRGRSMAWKELSARLGGAGASGVLPGQDFVGSLLLRCRWAWQPLTSVPRTPVETHMGSAAPVEGEPGESRRPQAPAEPATHQKRADGALTETTVLRAPRRPLMDPKTNWRPLAVSRPRRALGSLPICPGRRIGRPSPSAVNPLASLPTDDQSQCPVLAMSRSQREA